MSAPKPADNIQVASISDRGLSEKRPENEDSFLADGVRGIFVVADGVTLRKGLEFKKKYPWPSPAGQLAQKFCDQFIRVAKHSSLHRAFVLANRSVWAFNKKRDKSKTFLNAEAHYAATAAFGRIQGRVLEWGHICDSSVSVITKQGDVGFFRTDHLHHNAFDHILRHYSSLDQSYILRTVFRNALSSRGKKIGYGVITGEQAAEPYARFGKRKIKKGELAIFATDGFEDYLKIPSFRRALLTMDKKVVEKEMFRIKKAHKDLPAFVSERTLIAVRVD